jgi:HKD family nuclease
VPHEVSKLPNAITGINDHLHPYLAKAIQRADRIRLIVAFVMESGAKILVPQLKQAAERGAHIQLLTGRYLSVTEPSAIYYLYDHLEDAVDVRFYNETVTDISHP